MLTTVSLSVVAPNSMSSVLSLLTVYLAVAVTLPGKPFSPSFALIVKVTDESFFSVMS